MWSDIGSLDFSSPSPSPTNSLFVWQGKPVLAAIGQPRLVRLGGGRQEGEAPTARRQWLVQDAEVVEARPGRASLTQVEGCEGQVEIEQCNYTAHSTRN